MGGRRCENMIWGRRESWVLWRGSLDHIEKREREREIKQHTGDCTRKTLA